MKKSVIVSRIITPECTVFHMWLSIWYGAKLLISSTLRLSHVQNTLGTRGIISVIQIRTFAGHTRRETPKASGNRNQIEMDVAIRKLISFWFHTWHLPGTMPGTIFLGTTCAWVETSVIHISWYNMWGSTRAAAHIQLDCPVASWISRGGRRRPSTYHASFPSLCSSLSSLTWRAGHRWCSAWKGYCTSAINVPHRGNH